MELKVCKTQGGRGSVAVAASNGDRPEGMELGAKFLTTAKGEGHAHPSQTPSLSALRRVLPPLHAGTTLHEPPPFPRLTGKVAKAWGNSLLVSVRSISQTTDSATRRVWEEGKRQRAGKWMERGQRRASRR